MSKICVGLFDASRNLGERDLLCLVEALNFFIENNIASVAATQNLAIGFAFERLTYPVLKAASAFDREFVFDSSLVKQPCLTSSGAERSPSLMTFCKRMGLVEVLDANDSRLRLSYLSKLIKDKKLATNEYAFVLLSKQGVFYNGDYRGSLLCHVARFLNENNNLFDDVKFGDFLKRGFGDPAAEISSRLDLITNALRFSGLLKACVTGNGNLLISSGDSKDMFDDILLHSNEFMAVPADTDEHDKYVCNKATGITEILTADNREIFIRKYPGIKELEWTCTKTPRQKQASIFDLLNEFKKAVPLSGLMFTTDILSRLCSAILSKPLTILTGLSGSGKTKLAQALTEWLSCSMSSNDILLPNEIFNNGAYSLKDSDELDYKILVAESGKIRTVSKNAVKLWVKYLKENPNKRGGDSKEIRKSIQALDVIDDNYMHGSDAILNHIACDVLSRRDPFVSERSIKTQILVPVGADWTNSEHLLGYPDALQPGKYVVPETGVLKLMLDAQDNPNLPFFLILDEMNLSHVERYFADFLSAMESGDEIKLYDGDQRYADEAKTIAVPRRIRVPKNLFVIGTMNVDETTYMFSPKVLDRAQVIEFRVKPDEMAKFVGFGNNGNWQSGTATKIDLDKLADPNGIGKGAKYAESFLELALKRGEKRPSDQPDAQQNNRIPLHEVAKAINAFFEPLAKLGAEFGYRSASEIMSFCGYYLDAGATIDDAIDAAIVQKLLPKVHGSRRKLERVLAEIWKLCLRDNINDDLNTVIKTDIPYDFSANTKYPLSAEKVMRMFRSAVANGFASFAEA